MSMQQLKAWLAGFVAMYALEWVWFNILAAGNQVAGDSAVIREESLGLYTFLGYLVLALAMAWLYPRGYEGGSPLHEGLRFGAMMGVAVRLSSLLIAYSFWSLQLQGALIFALYGVVELAVGGVVIAWIYGSGEQAATEA